MQLFPIRGRMLLTIGLGGTALFTYFTTLSLFKTEKIDLRTVRPPVDSRPAPAALIPANRWTDEADNGPSAPGSAATLNTPTSVPAETVEPNTDQPDQNVADRPAGCNVPPGGGPPVNALFEPC